VSKSFIQMCRGSAPVPTPYLINRGNHGDLGRSRGIGVITGNWGNHGESGQSRGFGVITGNRGNHGDLG